MTTHRHIDTIPGDKSISHRAIILGSIAPGTVTFSGFLCSHDCLNTLAIFEALGVDIKRQGTTVTITSTGIKGWRSPSNHLDVGNSGTGIRLIAGALAGAGVCATITGDASIQQRPMSRIIDPLTQMGAVIDAKNGLPPLTISPSNRWVDGFEYAMPVASAQVKSAVLLAGLTANVPVTVIEPEPCRDHTERMLALFGADIRVDGATISLHPSVLNPPTVPVQIPADISSALFFICHALMTSQSLTIRHVGLNPSRTGCLAVLRAMGCQIEVDEYATSFEPMGDIHIKPSANRQNITVPLADIPNIIDELPILSALACTQTGMFRVRGAEELRVKESDRIAGIVRLVHALGGQVTEYDDGFDIHGPISTWPTTMDYDAHFDHRLAMSARIISDAWGISATISGLDSIPTSFPNFDDILAAMRTPVL